MSDKARSAIQILNTLGYVHNGGENWQAPAQPAMAVSPATITRTPAQCALRGGKCSCPTACELNMRNMEKANPLMTVIAHIVPAGPCHHCGCHGPATEFNVGGDSNRHTIKCDDCPARIECYSSTPEQAIAAWNRRAAPLALSDDAIPEGCVVIRAEVVRFLTGECPLDGVWFGEKHPTERGTYWWRKRLPDAPLGAILAAQEVK